MNEKNEYIELGLHQSAENSIGCWVNASEFERMSEADPNGSYISQANGPPRSKFFSLCTDAEELAYVMPCVQILDQPDGNAIYVQNGADRARWVIDSGVKEMPVAIYRDIGIEKAGTGLIMRRVQAGDVIRVKNGFNPELIITDKLAQRASIHKGLFDRLFQPQLTS